MNDLKLKRIESKRNEDSTYCFVGLRNHSDDWIDLDDNLKADDAVVKIKGYIQEHIDGSCRLRNEYDDQSGVDDYDITGSIAEKIGDGDGDKQPNLVLDDHLTELYFKKYNITVKD